MKAQALFCDRCGEKTKTLASEHITIETLVHGRKSVDLCEAHLRHMLATMAEVFSLNGMAAPSGPKKDPTKGYRRWPFKHQSRRIAAYLAAHPGATLTEVARALDYLKTAGPVLRRMRKAGLVIEEKQSGRHGILACRLTPKGKKLAQQQGSAP